MFSPGIRVKKGAEYMTSCCHLTALYIIVISRFLISCRMVYLLFKDVDECTMEKKPLCGPHSVCTNMIGKYRCSCKEGYEFVDDEFRVCKGKQDSAFLVRKKNNCSYRFTQTWFTNIYPWASSWYCVDHLLVKLNCLYTIFFLRY